VPPGGHDQPPAYLQFSSAYDSEARQAAGRRWPVRRWPDEHLASWWSPAGVAAVLTEFASLAGG